MNSLLQLLPLLITVALLLIGKRVSVSTISGIFAVFLLVITGHLSMPDNALITGVTSALILSMSAAVVIVSGQYLNTILQQYGTIKTISKWIQEIPISNNLKVLFIIVGIAPAIESLTGFGVSLFLCAPILMHLYPIEKSAKLSLLSMNIMPWGTLALATIIGATIAQMKASDLGSLTSYISFFVFPIIAMLGLMVIQCRKYSEYLIAIFLGALLSIQLVAYNYYLPVELAGVFSGIITAVIGGFIFVKNGGILPLNFEILKAVKPYFVLIVLVVISQVTSPLWIEFANLVAIKNDAITFVWLSSPSIFLAITAAYLHKTTKARLYVRELVQKVRRPIVSIFLFLLLSQAMLLTGNLSRIADMLIDWFGGFRLIVSPTIGMISGYISGSNLGGNALMMNLQTSLGADINHRLFAAIQNSSAGHAVFASLPIIILVIAIAKDMGFEIQEKVLVRFSLLCLIPIWVALVISSVILRIYIE